MFHYESKSEWKNNISRCYLVLFLLWKASFNKSFNQFSGSFLFRYINHGGKRDANVRPHPPLFINGKPRVAFLSLRHIKAGEEILWDYGADIMRYKPMWMKDKVYTIIGTFFFIRSYDVLGIWAALPLFKS